VQQPASTPSVERAALSACQGADNPEPLVERMIDPLNRYYRYPVARWAVPYVRRTRVSPNQLTVLHTAIGLAAAACVVRGSASARIGACLLAELRLIVDCLDGVLARATHTATTYGRTLDALGDAVSYVALCMALAVATGAWMLALSVLAAGALMAWMHDFYARKFSTALRAGTDSVYEQLREKHEAIAARGAGFVIRFGYAFDWLQILFLAPHARRAIAPRLRDPSGAGDAAAAAGVRSIVAHAHSRRARAAFRAVSVVAGDNALAILNVGLLTGRLVAAERIVLLYGMIAATAGLVLCHRFLKHAGATAA